MDDLGRDTLMRDISKRRDTLRGFLEILNANKEDPEPIRKERIIHFLETAVKFMNDVYVLLESQVLLNASYTKRHQISIEMITLLSEHQNNPLIRQRLSALLRDYEQSF